MANTTIDGKLLMKDCAKARDELTAKYQQQIKGLYNEWTMECNKLANKYKNAGDVMSAHYYNALTNAMMEQYAVVSEQVENKVKQSMFTVADSVVKAQAAFCVKAGLTGVEGATMAFSGFSPTIVNNIVSGQIYEGGWNLSKAIWGDNQKTLQDIHNIIAGGYAAGESVFDTAKKLEEYVNPNKRKPWNFRCADGKYIYKKQVDYNAQRLVRTLTQHAYQQATVGAWQINPLVDKVRWVANGSRVCPLCQDMDGQLFDLGSVPLDHPNGMCVMEPVVQDGYVDRIADWAAGGEDDELDAFALNFGYDAKKDPNFKPKTELDLLLEKMDKAAAQTSVDMSKYTDDNFKDLNSLLDGVKGATDDYKTQFSRETEFLSKYANNSKYKQWQGLKNNLTDDEIATATALKERSGLSWKAWYEQYLQKSGVSNSQKVADATIDTAEGLITKKAPTRYAYEGKINPQAARYDIDDVMAAYSRQSYRQHYDVEKSSLKCFDAVDDSLLHEYTGSNYDKINDYMRRRRAGESFEQIASDNWYVEFRGREYMEDFEQVADKMLDFTYHESMVIRRTGGTSELAQMLQGMDNPITGETMDFKSAGKFVGNMVNHKDEQLLADINNRLQGTEFTFNNFVSTSCDSNKQLAPKTIELFVNAPNGVHGRPIMTVSQYDTMESEILLAPGQKLRIDDIRFGYGYDSRMQIYATALM